MRNKHGASVFHLTNTLKRRAKKKKKKTKLEERNAKWIFACQSISACHTQEWWFFMKIVVKPAQQNNALRLIYFRTIFCFSFKRAIRMHFYKWSVFDVCLWWASFSFILHLSLLILSQFKNIFPFFFFFFLYRRNAFRKKNTHSDDEQTKANQKTKQNKINGLGLSIHSHRNNENNDTAVVIIIVVVDNQMRFTFGHVW